MQVAARRSTLAARVVAAAPTARPLARGLRLAVARRPLAAAPLVASARALARATPLPTRLSARGLATLPSHTVLTFPALSPVRPRARRRRAPQTCRSRRAPRTHGSLAPARVPCVRRR